MAKDRRSRDQKRKAKLAKKQQKARQSVSLAYLGEKYKTDELVPTWLATETAIYEAYVMLDRKLLDQTVVAAVEALIKPLRAGTLPPLEDDGTLHIREGQEQDLVMQNIRRHWALHFEKEWKPPRDKLIGVLRTILGSIEKVRAPGPRSQSYMRHIAGFLTKQIGIKVEQFSAEMKPIPEPDEEELVLLGRRWIEDGRLDVRSEFHELASDLIQNGQAAGVVDACHQLIGEVSDPASAVLDDLLKLRESAGRSLVAAMG
jgi:hypothetical protein